MKNVTITLDEDTAAWVRIEAARHDMSVSRLVGEMLREKRGRDIAYEAAHARFKATKPVPLKAEGERYPAREELYDRACLR